MKVLMSIANNILLSPVRLTTIDLINHGLTNACKKKILLYKYFLKSRSRQSEDKYKTYKNKLTTIPRKCEKNDNTKLPELNKGNLKESWKL